MLKENFQSQNAAGKTIGIAYNKGNYQVVDALILKQWEEDMKKSILTLFAVMFITSANADMNNYSQEFAQY